MDISLSTLVLTGITDKNKYADYDFNESGSL